MIDLRPVIFVIGVLLSILALAMVVPAMIDLLVGHRDWLVFTAAATLTLFVGVSMALMTRSGRSGLNIRQAFLMTNLAWIVTAGFGALPFAFSELELDFTDAFFEAMSGVTTTGSTVIVGLDTAAPGILLWRALLQWLGGVGIIVLAITILPILRVGGMQMFRVEAFEAEKVLPRAAEIAGEIGLVYVALTAIAAILLYALGMNGFDAVAHAMTTIATGGFSTADASVGAFDSAAIDYTMSLIMICGSLPFVLYLRALRGDVGSFHRDSQVRGFVAVLVVAIGLVVAQLVLTDQMPIHDALRYGTFNVISMMTGSGFATADFGQWGTFAMAVIFVVMFIGGCAGSTTCGIKIFRLQVLFATASLQLRRLLRPHGMFVAYYNGRPIPDPVAASVMGFFFLFILGFIVLSAGLAATGVDFVTAITGAATAIANVGPGLGNTIGPAGNFASLPDSAKWMLSAGMLLGRLELFTVLVLFSPGFWRN